MVYPAFDDTVFDPVSGEALGSLSSFRCTEFGLTCDGDNVTRSAATYESCEPRGNSPYLTHPDEYVDFLSSLKDDAGKVILAVIVGDREPLEVAPDDRIGSPKALPSCSGPGGVAIAGFRLGYLADQFENSLVASICEPDLSDALIFTANLITQAMQENQEPELSNGEQPPDESSSGVLCNVSGSSSIPGLALLGLAFLAVFWRRRV